MSIIDFIAEQWSTILLITVTVAAYIIFALDSEKPIVDKIIFLTVTELEKQYGGGTGALKLAAAINLIYPKLPAVTRRFITEEKLRGWIEAVLEEAKKKWSTNEAIKEYIKPAQADA